MNAQPQPALLPVILSKRQAERFRETYGARFDQAVTEGRIRVLAS